MQLVRAPIAANPLSFGKAPKPAVTPAPAPVCQSTLSDDVRLFATTFAAGFIFVSLFLA